MVNDWHRPLTLFCQCIRLLTGFLKLSTIWVLLSHLGCPEFQMNGGPPTTKCPHILQLQYDSLLYRKFFTISVWSDHDFYFNSNFRYGISAARICHVKDSENWAWYMYIYTHISIIFMISLLLLLGFLWFWVIHSLEYDVSLWLMPLLVFFWSPGVVLVMHS